MKMTFGERLKSEREKKKFSRVELSKRVGLHYTQIGRYERNEANPASEVLSKISDELDVTTDFLMNGTTTEWAEEKIKDKNLINQFKKIATLSDENKKVVVTLIDAFLFQQEMKNRLAS